jgi:hypothetical protein
MQTQAMTEDVLARAYLLSFALMAKYKGRMTVQLDVLHREQALRSPASVYAGDCWDGAERASDQLGVIVLEPDGSVVSSGLWLLAPVHYLRRQQGPFCRRLAAICQDRLPGIPTALSRRVRQDRIVRHAAIVQLA